jgi:hypothetical protein
VLATQEARAGHRAAAERAYAAAVRVKEVVTSMQPTGSPRRAMLEIAPGAWRARVQLYAGEDGPALENAAAAVERLRQVEIPAGDDNGQGIRDNALRFSLTTASAAAIRLGRYAEAEAKSRERLALPPSRFGTNDPQDETSRASVMLAHAIALQGRPDEARDLVRPQVDIYRAEQKLGATGLSFHVDLAYALYVNAIARAEGNPSRAQADAELAEAARLLDALPAEARQLADVRELGTWIRTARGAGGA